MPYHSGAAASRAAHEPSSGSAAATACAVEPVTTARTNSQTCAPAASSTARATVPASTPTSTSTPSSAAEVAEIVRGPDAAPSSTAGRGPCSSCARSDCSAATWSRSDGTAIPSLATELLAAPDHGERAVGVQGEGLRRGGDRRGMAQAETGGAGPGEGGGHGGQDALRRDERVGEQPGTVDEPDPVEPAVDGGPCPCDDVGVRGSRHVEQHQRCGRHDRSRTTSQTRQPAGAPAADPGCGAASTDRSGRPATVASV